MNKVSVRFILLLMFALLTLSACSEDEPAEIATGDFHMLQINLFHVDGGQYLVVNTDSLTLGDEINRQNQDDEIEEPVLITLKETEEGSIIHEFDGMKNNEKYKWTIYSESCEDGICPDDVFSIELDEDLEFMIVYEDR